MTTTFKAATERLHKERYYTFCMMKPLDYEYEVYDRDGNVIIDHLSEAQVIQLAKLIEQIRKSAN